MKLKSTIIATTTALAFTLAGCTNPTSTAGSKNTYYDGVIQEIDLIDIDTKQMSTGTNTVIGAIAGAILGNMVNKHTTGTAVGAGLGAVVGNAVSGISNRADGVRLTIESDNGPLIIDMPFSCKYKVGRKVRLISSGDTGSIMVKVNGKYKTATQDSYKTCPAVYEELKGDD